MWFSWGCGSALCAFLFCCPILFLVVFVGSILLYTFSHGRCSCIRSILLFFFNPFSLSSFLLRGLSFLGKGTGMAKCEMRWE